MEEGKGGGGVAGGLQEGQVRQVQAYGLETKFVVRGVEQYEQARFPHRTVRVE